MNNVAPTPIVVLASGRGSNFKSLVDSIENGRLNAKVSALVVDRENTGVAEFAEKKDIPTFVVLPTSEKTPEARDRHEAEILKKISPFAPKFIVMAGYKRILNKKLIETFQDSRGYSRIVNVHPSLLPAFPGVGSYAKAFDNGCKVTGVTIHLVEHGVDEGPICAQEAFDISGCSSSEEVESRGLEVEHRLYPETLNWILNEEFRLEGRRCVRSS